MKTLKLFTTVLFLLLTLQISAQSTQTIRGCITDEVSNTTLPGATVIVVADNIQPMGGVADADGNYRIANVPTGRITIKVTLIGYEEKIFSNVILTSAKELILNISLLEKISSLAEAKVEYDRTKDKTTTNNEMTSVSARSFNVEETQRYAGSLGDPSRMAANFAGVVGANDARNDIVVRGNSPIGLLWQLDGMNIPNPNHFGSLGSTGGPVSMLNNNTLDKSDFLTGAFPSQYGNATAGVFDLRLRNGNDEHHEFLTQMGFNGVELGAEGPISKSKKSSYLVNYRYSTLAIFENLGINFGTGSATPIYQDVNFKVNLPLDKKNTLSVFGIAGNSRVTFLGNDVDTTQTNLYGSENTNTFVKYATGIIGVSLETNINSKTTSTFTIGSSATYEDYKGDSISVETREAYPSGEGKFETQKLSAIFNLTHKFNPKNNLQVGASSDVTFFKLYNTAIYQGTINNVYVDVNDHAFLTQAFGQWKHRFNEKLTLIAGLHTQHYTTGNAFSVEPRAGLKYFFTPNQSLRFGYGLHSQVQNIYDYNVQTNTPNGIEYTNKNLDLTKSNHLVLGYENRLAQHVMLTVETYYQRLFNVPVMQTPSSFSSLNTGADFAPSNEDSLVNKGTGYNYGLEITLEHYFNKGYYFLFTTSLFNSRYEGSDKTDRNTAFNTGYVVNALGGKEFKVGKKKNVLALDLRLSTTGGRYLTPIDYTASEAAGTAVYITSEAYSERQPAYFRCDLKLSYRKNYKKSSLEFALDLQNITNHQNVFSQTYNPRTNSISTEYQQGFFPIPMVKYTF